MKMEMKNKSHRYGIIDLDLHMDINIVNIKCLRMRMLI